MSNEKLEMLEKEIESYIKFWEKKEKESVGEYVEYTRGRIDSYKRILEIIKSKD